MLKLLRRKVSLLNVINKFKQFCDNFEVGLIYMNGVIIITLNPIIIILLNIFIVQCCNKLYKSLYKSIKMSSEVSLLPRNRNCFPVASDRSNKKS